MTTEVEKKIVGDVIIQTGIQKVTRIYRRVYTYNREFARRYIKLYQLTGYKVKRGRMEFTRKLFGRILTRTTDGSRYPGSSNLLYVLTVSQTASAVSIDFTRHCDPLSPSYIHSQLSHKERNLFFIFSYVDPYYTPSSFFCFCHSSQSLATYYNFLHTLRHL